MSLVLHVDNRFFIYILYYYVYNATSRRATLLYIWKTIFFAVKQWQIVFDIHFRASCAIFPTFQNRQYFIMIQEFQIRVLPEVAAQEERLKAFLHEDKGISPKAICHIRILKRSIDARQRRVFVNLTLRVFINEEPTDDVFERVEYRDVSNAPRVVVVGAGPGGLFAALRLIELGLCPVVLERGKDVHERKKDLARIKREQCVDPESNYCFGEGGAGAYSDGKLYTRSKKRGSVDKILRVFCQHGAPLSILSDAHPHIGTDKLPGVIEAMRNTIILCGGEVHFLTKMTEIIVHENTVRGVVANGKEFLGPVILATGHSARDVYRYLFDNNILMEAKGIAVGVRLEHPSALIDQIQYHSRNGRGHFLPAAEYSFVTQVQGRGVYSFCMCPGGYVIPAATADRQIVVNGMSPSSRGGKWSNSGMVVEVRPEDLPQHNDPLSVMSFQENLEQMCWQQGNMKQTAPAQRMVDFVNGKLSTVLPPSSYAPGLIASPLHFWLPEMISSRLREGFRVFGKKSHGFLTNEACLIAVETRTSAPVRILRDAERLHHVTLQGLFPCGEGAGYAGGIVSAGVDGERCAEMVKEYLS